MEYIVVFGGEALDRGVEILLFRKAIVSFSENTGVPDCFPFLRSPHALGEGSQFSEVRTHFYTLSIEQNRQ